MISSRSDIPLRENVHNSDRQDYLLPEGEFERNCDEIRALCKGSLYLTRCRLFRFTHEEDLPLNKGVSELTTITVARGDGIGPEIMDATLKVLKAAGARLNYEEVEIGEKQ